MNNAGMTGALVLIGAGLFANAFMGNTQTVQAVPVPAAVAVQGDVEPTIVWYDSHQFGSDPSGSNGELIRIALLRAWSDGTVEARFKTVDLSTSYGGCVSGEYGNCSTWYVLSSPTEGLSAAADINFDEVVNGQDLAVLLARWGDAPRNPMPPSDCPLGLLN